MNIRLLPSYTTERYYILSEIEDRADFELREAKEGGARNTASDHGDETSNTCDAFYLLWDLRDSSSKSNDSFMVDVKKLLPKILELRTVLARSLCCIEIVISNESCWKSKNLEKVVDDVIQWMDKSCEFGCIYVGICDSVGGAPALEAILDYSKIIEDHNIHSSLIRSKNKNKSKSKSESEVIKLRVVALSATDMLGHDPSREPDAVSGVYQGEYIHSRQCLTALNNEDSTIQNDESITEATEKKFSDELTLSQWAESVGLQHTKIPRDINGQRGSNVGDMKGGFWRSSISLIVVISVCIAAYIFQLQSRTII